MTMSQRSTLMNFRLMNLLLSQLAAQSWMRLRSILMRNSDRFRELVRFFSLQSIDCQRFRRKHCLNLSRSGRRRWSGWTQPATLSLSTGDFLAAPIHRYRPAMMAARLRYHLIEHGLMETKKIVENCSIVMAVAAMAAAAAATAVAVAAVVGAVSVASAEVSHYQPFSSPETTQNRCSLLNSIHFAFTTPSPTYR